MPVTLICEACHCPFTRPQRRNPVQRYCSPKCNAVRFINQIERTCTICGTVFHRQAAKISPYCCDECSNIGHRKDLGEAFWAKVEKTPDCWLWTGGKGRFGHGLFTKGNKGGTVGAHRFSYEQAYGPIPDGLAVCHHCDVPACVRPDHLFLGTRTDNNHDKVRKGRQSKGESIGLSKLTEDDVRAIRSATIPRGELNAFAKRYGVWPETISRIRLRSSWKHLD